jgi:hypothetical protein
MDGNDDTNADEPQFAVEKTFWYLYAILCGSHF